MIRDERGGRHPAGGAAADDHDLADRIVSQKTNSGSGGGAAGSGAAQVRAMNSAMRRQPFRGLEDRLPHLLERGRDLLLVQRVDGRLVIVGNDPWPSITATQLVVANSSSPSRNTRPLARHRSILRARLSGIAIVRH